MASSTFSDIPATLSDRSSLNNTLIIIVNNDGTLSVDQETLHGLLAEQETSSTTAVRLIRLGVAPDDGRDSSDSEESNSSHVNITVEGYYPPSMSQGYQHGNDDIVDPFLGMDPEEMERLESALQSDEAKQILGEDVAAMLDILSVDENTMCSTHLHDSIKMDHCYTNRLPASTPPGVSSTTPVLASTDPFSAKGPGRPRKDYSVRNPRTAIPTSTSNLVMVKHIKPINPPLQVLQTSIQKKSTAAKSSTVTNEGASGSILKKNITTIGKANTTPCLTEEMLNEKLQEIQRSADEYTNLSGDDLEERSNSSIDQSIDVEEVLQSTEPPSIANTTKRTGGKSSIARRVEIRGPDNSQLQKPTQSTTKLLRMKPKLETQKGQSNQSLVVMNNSPLAVTDHPTTGEGTPQQITKKNYPKRENRKLPARLTEVFGPALFSTLDVPRRVSLDSKTADFRRENEKLIEHGGLNPAMEGAFIADSVHTLDRERRLPSNLQEMSVGGSGKAVEQSRHSSTEGSGHLSGRRRSDEIPASLRGRSPRQSLDNSDVTDADSELMMGENTEDDPHKLWCICKRPHNNRFMICCDSCEEWFHGKCVGVTKALGKTMEEEGNEWTCPNCKKKGKDNASKNPLKKQMKMTTFLSNVTKQSPVGIQDVQQPSEKQDTAVKPASNVTVCIVCKKQARANSIYCSDVCILKHAKDSKPTAASSTATLLQEKTVSKSTTNVKKHAPVVSTQRASQSGSLKAWLQANPTIKVIKTSLPTTTSQGTVVVVKSPQAPVTKPKQALMIAPKPMSPLVLKMPTKQTAADVSQKAVAAKSGPSGGSGSHGILPSEKVHTGAKPHPSPSSSLLKEKAVVSKVESKRQSLADVPKKEEKKIATEPIRLNVRNTLHELLLARIQECEDLKSIADDKVKKMGVNIEEELYLLFRDVGAKYKSKYRSLVFNIKDPKNFTLFRKIAEKSITPFQLVRLTPEEMASQEMAEWRERESQHELELIKKNELDLMALSKTYVMKTHKGEQVIESEDGVKNDVPQIDNLDSLVVSNSVTSTVSDIDGQDKPKTSKKVRSKRSDGKSSKSRKSKKDKKDRRKEGKSHSRSSHSKDKHHSKTHSDRKKAATTHDVKDFEKSNEHERNKIAKAACPVMDEISIKEVILGKLEDDVSNADLEPTSTVNIKTPEINYSEDTPIESDSSIVWKGVAEMPEVAKFLTTIHIVSGDSEHHCQSLSNKLDVVGRITPKLVWDHVSKMKKSDSYDIMVIRLEAASESERIPYATLYTYLNSRNRLGVVGVKGIVGPVSPLIKDFYIMPLSKHSPLPQEILPLNGPGLSDDRQHLLLGILVARSSKKRAAGAPPSSVGPPAAKIFRSVDTPDVASAAVRSYTPPLPEEPVTTASHGISLHSTSHKGMAEAEEKRPHLEELAAIKLRVSHLLNEDGDAPYSPGDEEPTAEDLLATPTNADDMQRKMEELNRKIAEEKQEIENISSSFADDAGAGIGGNVMPRFLQDKPIPSSDDNEAYSPSESITPPLQSNIPFLSSIETSGSSSFIPNVSQDIALPSNLQEILASIKKQSDTKLDIKLDPIVQSYATRMNEESREEPEAIIPKNIKSTKEVASSSLSATQSFNKQPKASTTPSTLSKLSDKELIEKAAAMERELEMETSPIEINKVPSSIKVAPVKYSSSDSSVFKIDTDGLLNLPLHPSKTLQHRPPPGVDDFTSYPLPPPVPNYPPPRYNIPLPDTYPPPPPLPPPDYPAPPFAMTSSNYNNAYAGPETGHGSEGNKRKHTGNDASMQGHYLNSGKKGNQHWGGQ